MQKTVTDYEVQEVEQTVMVCDHCKMESEDESDFINIEINPSVVTTSEAKVTGTVEAESERKAEMKMHTAFRSADGPDMHESLYELEQEVSVDNIDSDGGADLCETCVGEIFNIDADGEIQDVDIRRGDIHVESEEVIEKKYPELQVSPSNKKAAAFALLLFPFVLFFTSLDIISIRKEHNWKNWEAGALLLLGSLGTLIWGGIFVLALSQSIVF